MNTKEKHWEDILRTWKRSGSTQDDFCRAERIAISTFRYWKKRLEGSGAESRFIRVVTENMPRKISVTFDTGIHMIFPAATSNELLGRIIHAVNEALCESTGTR